MNKRETNLNEIKRLIDCEIENEDCVQLDESGRRLIQSVEVYEDLRECIEFGALDLFIYEEEDIEEKELFEALGLEDEDLDEIYLYYVQKLCKQHNLDYKLARNRVEYIVFTKDDSIK